MCKVAVFLATVVCILGISLNEAQLSNLNGRIVGGNLTTISLFPWQVSLQVDGVHVCGASIYSEYIIVTAAHCLQGFPEDSLKIRAGTSFWNVGGVLIEVASYKFHEKFDLETVNYDIGVIRLKTPLKFSITTQPIPLTSVEPQYGAAVLISGWGTTKSASHTISTVLQYIHSSAIDSEKCRDPFYGYGDKIHSSMTCAASPGKDTCQYDSGGPMVSEGVLVGVVSWGIGCANNTYPGVYANVAVLKNWIEEAAKTV